jgi:hypothetical protein
MCEYGAIAWNSITRGTSWTQWTTMIGAKTSAPVRIEHTQNEWPTIPIVEEIPIVEGNHLQTTQTLTLTIVGWYHNRFFWVKHTTLILMLSSVVHWKASNTFASMWIKAAIWLCFELKIPMRILLDWISMTKERSTNLAGTSTWTSLEYLWFRNSWTRSSSYTFSRPSWKRTASIFFENETAFDPAINPSKTMITEYFELWILLVPLYEHYSCSEVTRCFIWVQAKKLMPHKERTQVDACPGLFRSYPFGSNICSQLRRTVDPSRAGKTYLILPILAKIWPNYGIALAVASSEIAATLLDGVRTAHLAFKLPLNIQNNSDAVCDIEK